MKRRSSKVAAIYREWLPVRKDFLFDKPVCCLCGGMACDVHECPSGYSRMDSFVRRACWLRVCRMCHEQLQNMSKTEQLLLKLKTDLPGFDLISFHEAWGRPATAIMADDIAKYGGPHNRQTPDMRGQRFGRLTPIYSESECGRCAKWCCICDCGKASIVRARNLRKGLTKSCGCLQKEVAAAANTKHGHSSLYKHSATYSSWHAMINRCGNGSFKQFKDYGGRGIRVCDRWKKFENFLADMGERPKGRTLDRIDNDGNYEPSNCRWATRVEQAANRGRAA